MVLVLWIWVICNRSKIMLITLLSLFSAEVAGVTAILVLSFKHSSGQFCDLHYVNTQLTQRHRFCPPYPWYKPLFHARNFTYVQVPLDSDSSLWYRLAIHIPVSRIQGAGYAQAHGLQFNAYDLPTFIAELPRVGACLQTIRFWITHLTQIPLEYLLPI